MPRPTSPRAAVLWGFVFFVGLQAVLFAGRETLFPEWRDPEYGLKWHSLQRITTAEPARPLLVVLGSSRTACGVRPDVLPPLVTPDGAAARVFNGAMLGSGPVAELMCLRRLLADGARPRWLLIEVWPPLLSQDDDNAEARRIRPSCLRRDDMDLLNRVTPEIGPRLKKQATTRWFPAYSSRFQLLALYAPALLPPRQQGWAEGVRNLKPDGWLPIYGTGDPGVRRAHVRGAEKKFAPTIRTLRISRITDLAYREMLDLCRENGIRAGLVYLPESEEFQGWYPSAVRGEVDIYLRGLSEKFAVPLFDLRDWMEESDFNDGYHLLPEAAEKFTRRLGREVLPRFLGCPGGAAAAGSSDDE